MRISKGIKLKNYNLVNLCVLLLQSLAWFTVIFLLHQDLNIMVKIGLGLFFCLMMQGVFSFMHECFHGSANTNKKVNWFLGFWSSTLFGTAYTFFERNHEGHHVRNRTRPELVDYIFPDESAAKKVSIYYLAIFGGIWLGGLILPLICFFIPDRLKTSLAIDTKNNTYAEAFNQFSSGAWRLMKIETVLLLTFWISVIYIFNWDITILATLYFFFAFSWSSLQWVYHVRTPIHRVEGAYNLRAPWLIRALFLNFNYNLTHHRNSAIPWQELFSASNQQETQPLWHRYLRIFLPPQTMPKDIDKLEKTYF
jgi:fatty acid desaturase